MDIAQKYNGFYAEHFGPAFKPIATDPVKDSIFVMTYPAKLPDGTTFYTLVTKGLGCFRMNSIGGGFRRVEIFAHALTIEPWGKLVRAISEMILDSNAPLLPGYTMHCPELYPAGSMFNSVYLAMPSPRFFNGNRQPLKVDEEQVTFLNLMPVTGAERNYVLEYHYDDVQARVAHVPIPYLLDVRRTPFFRHE